MICPKCGDKAKVVDSRQINEYRIRRNQCKSCRHLFYSREQLIPWIDGMKLMDIYAEQRKEVRTDGKQSADS